MLYCSICSCDPGFQYYIQAKTSDIIIETSPSIEAVYCYNSSLPTNRCDFAKSHRINDDKEKEQGIYKMSQGEEVSVYGGVGFQGSSSDFPFSYIKIIKLGDTTIYQNKGSILQKFERKQKGGKNVYVLQL